MPASRFAAITFYTLLSWLNILSASQAYEFVGVPVIQTMIDEFGRAQTVAIEASDAQAMKLVIHAKKGGLLWVSRENEPLCGGKNGDYYDFYSIKGHGSIRIAPATTQKLRSQVQRMIGKDGMTGYPNSGVASYTEVLYNHTGVIIYQGYTLDESLFSTETMSFGEAHCATQNPYTR